MYKIVPVLKKLMPFIMTLFLWRLSVYFWNPAGILCLIPVFYYTFVRPVNNFTIFALIFCFLIDYRCNLPLFWTCLFCLFYAINGFQNYIDFQHTNNNAIYAFMAFIGIGIFLLIISGFTWINLINNLWLFVWLSILYTPVTAIDNWVTKS
jgi:hypothetical protein